MRRAGRSSGCSRTGNPSTTDRQNASGQPTAPPPTAARAGTPARASASNPRIRPTRGGKGAAGEQRRLGRDRRTPRREQPGHRRPRLRTALVLDASEVTLRAHTGGRDLAHALAGVSGQRRQQGRHRLVAVVADQVRRAAEAGELQDGSRRSAPDFSGCRSCPRSSAASRSGSSADGLVRRAAPAGDGGDRTARHRGDVVGAQGTQRVHCGPIDPGPAGVTRCDTTHSWSRRRDEHVNPR